MDECTERYNVGTLPGTTEAFRAASVSQTGWRSWNCIKIAFGDRFPSSWQDYNFDFGGGVLWLAFLRG